MVSRLQHVLPPGVGRDSCTPRRHRSERSRYPVRLRTGTFSCTATTAHDDCLELENRVCRDSHPCEEADEMQMGCNRTARGIYHWSSASDLTIPLR